MLARLPSLSRAATGPSIVLLVLVGCRAPGQTLEVKPGTHAIVKEHPTGDAPQFPDRLDRAEGMFDIGH